MSRLALAALAAAAALGSACTKNPAPGVTIALRQPSSLAIFHGYVLDRTPADASTTLRPYLAVANTSRNDLTIVDATDDTAVESPIQLRALVVPVADRPTLLAAASLGDGKADLLVAVSGGDSVLQVVGTWTPATPVHSDLAPAAGPRRAVDLGADVLALAVLPSAQGTARVAAALSNRSIAVAEWSRQQDADGSIALVGVTQGPTLAFQPLDLAALPGDPAETELYAATLDEVVAGSGTFGVAAISPDLATVRAMDARGPTRLVAALRLRERQGSSTASDTTAFEVSPGSLAAPERRVYAVLDESGCGRDRKIDCGVVTLDPTTNAIPADSSGRMPYRAPMRVEGRIAALAVSQPPAVAPPGAEAAYPAGEFMRLFDGTTERATTGVAVVASDGALGGTVYYLDLGRFEAATSLSLVAARNGITVTPVVVNAARLWPVARDAANAPSFPSSTDDAAATLTVTPGYTPDDTFSVAYQDFLPGLSRRNGEAGLTGGPGSDVWIALQRGEGPPAAGRSVTNVVRLFHPALGVHEGDRVVVKAAGVPGCTGTDPVELGTTPAGEPLNGNEKEFEAVVAALLAPSDVFPGGAVRLAPLRSVPSADPNPPADPWIDCHAALVARIGTASGATHLDVSIRAGDVLLTGVALGYAGRPVLGTRYVLEYPTVTTEDALAGACPIADWDGSFPSTVDFTCGGTGCPRGPASDCEKLVLARKARRIQGLSYPCEDDACRAFFPGVTFPEGNGPALAFEADVQGGCATTGAASTCDPTVPTTPEQRTAALVRGLVLPLKTSSNILLLLSRPTTGLSQASGAIAFDRSPWNADTGYRFLLSYPGDFVIDVSPHVFVGNKPDEVVIR